MLKPSLEAKAEYRQLLRQFSDDSPYVLSIVGVACTLVNQGPAPADRSPLPSDSAVIPDIVLWSVWTHARAGVEGVTGGKLRYSQYELQRAEKKEDSETSQTVTLNAARGLSRINLRLKANDLRVLPKSDFHSPRFPRNSFTRSREQPCKDCPRQGRFPEDSETPRCRRRQLCALRWLSREE